MNLTNIRKAHVENGEHNRLVWLADTLFRLEAYDDAQKELFARKALEVCEALSCGSVPEYIIDAENKQWYYLLMNTRFFSGNVENDTWTESLDVYIGIYEDSPDLFPEVFAGTSKEWNKFIRALIRFAITPN